MFKRFWWVFPVMAMVGPVLGFAFAFLLTQMIPKQYESQTVIEMKPRVMFGIAEASHAVPPPPPAESMENHKALIKSPEVLALTAENLKLAERWSLGRNDTLAVLTKIVDVDRIRGTDLWSIQVLHTDKAAARDIANGVASAYRQHRDETQAKQAESILRAINKEVRSQEDIVEDLRKSLMAAAAKLPDKGKSAGKAFTSPDFTAAKSEFVAAQDVLQELKLKQMGETISRKIPGESVEMHAPALISAIPVSPNVTLNLVLGTAAGFFLSPLLALPVMWLLGRFMPAKR